MIRLAIDAAEIQGLAQSQAARQQPAQGIAAQWSAAHAGMGPSPLGPLAQPSPLPAGLGGQAVPAPRPLGQQAQARNDEEEREADDFSWGGAGQGAVRYGATGAAIGTKILPGWGTAIGAGVGALAGGLAGGLGG